VEPEAGAAGGDGSGDASSAGGNAEDHSSDPDRENPDHAGGKPEVSAGPDDTSTAAISIIDVTKN
jgi:hypothetical protein